MNASRTAARLYIHRSTFLQRMEQVEKLTGIDLQNMRERTFLQLRVQFRIGIWKITPDCSAIRPSMFFLSEFFPESYFPSTAGILIYCRRTSLRTAISLCMITK